VAEFQARADKEFKEIGISIKEVNFLIDACRVDLEQALDGVKAS